MKIKKLILVSVILLISITANAQIATSRSQNCSATVSMIPFQLVNNLIVVQASIDGKRGNFIIDTGSEFMVLNAKYFSGHRDLDGHIRGFSGSGAAFRERMIWFSWGKHDEKMYRAIITPFGALERILVLCKDQIAG
jgi:hypothetical protein